VVVGIDSQTAGEGYPGAAIHRRSERSRDTARATRSSWVARCSAAAPARSCSIAWPATACADGYDIEQLRAVRALCRVPLVASGGAGTPAHFAEVFERSAGRCGARRQRVSFRRHRHPDLKRALRADGHRGTTACDPPGTRRAGPPSSTGTRRNAAWAKGRRLAGHRAGRRQRRGAHARVHESRRRCLATQASGRVTFWSRSKSVAQGDAEVIAEAADLLYHVVLLLEAKGLSLARVVAELAARGERHLG
jgi:hypothetical protein